MPDDKSGSETTDAAERWRHHLDALLARPGETIVLAGASPDGGMSLQVGAGDAQALLWIARSLIERAQDRGGGACCQAALDVLPDGFRLERHAVPHPAGGFRCGAGCGGPGMTDLWGRLTCRHDWICQRGEDADAWECERCGKVIGRMPSAWAEGSNLSWAKSLALLAIVLSVGALVGRVLLIAGVIE